MVKSTSMFSNILKGGSVEGSVDKFNFGERYILESRNLGYILYPKLIKEFYNSLDGYWPSESPFNNCQYDNLLVLAKAFKKVETIEDLRTVFQDKYFRDVKFPSDDKEFVLDVCGGHVSYDNFHWETYDKFYSLKDGKNFVDVLMHQSEESMPREFAVSVCKWGFAQKMSLSDILDFYINCLLLNKYGPDEHRCKYDNRLLTEVFNNAESAII